MSRRSSGDADETLERILADLEQALEPNPDQLFLPPYHEIEESDDSELDQLHKKKMAASSSEDNVTEPPPVLVAFERLDSEASGHSSLHPNTGATQHKEKTLLTNGSNSKWTEDEAEEDPEQQVKYRAAQLHRMRSRRTRYFCDGERRVDFVLAYQPGVHERDQTEMKRKLKRIEFEENLRQWGLELETEPVEHSQDGRTCFVKIHATWDVLASRAEIMKIKMPIRPNDTEKDPIKSMVDKCFKSVNPFELGIEEEADYFTAPFSREREHQFIMTDKEKFFSTSQRCRMVYNILIQTRYDSLNPQRIGVRRLIKNGAYTAAFPLHEGDVLSEEDSPPVFERKSNDRQLLYDVWAKPSRFYKYQPLDLIRRYFGEKIAIYFAWLGYYTFAIFPAAFIGILVVFYGASTLPVDVVSSDVCNGSGVGNLTMCPQCEPGCDFWKLSANCRHARVAHVFDNIATVLFAVVMSVWATLFLEGWKRYEAEIAWDWDLTDFEFEEEQIRPEYVTQVKGRRLNPITQAEEPYMPFRRRLMRLSASCVTVLFFLCLVLVFVIGVIAYRVIMSHILYKEDVPMASTVTSITGAILNLICIILLSKLYNSLAWKLTSWEFPRTDEEFENSYTIKVFSFQFLNFYSSLFYIAFIKGKFAVMPGTPDAQKYTIFMGYPMESCPASGCMVELVIQLAIIMVGKQFFSNFMEICFPIIYNWWRSRSSNWESEHNTYTRWEKDYALNDVPAMFLFDEYLEMVIQYGFITLFVAAFPLAPLFALINNIMEIRLDAYKYVVAYRRSTPQRCKDLGIWNTILDGVSKVAVLTNACVIAFTSDFVPKMLYSIEKGNGTLKGYMENSLAYFDVNYTDLHRPTDSPFGDDVRICRFSDYRKTPCSLNITESFNCGLDYEKNIDWWHIIAAKLAFILIFEHLVFLVKGMVAYFIPDIPNHIVIQMKREQFLAKSARVDYELEQRIRENQKKLEEEAEMTMEPEAIPLQDLQLRRLERDSSQPSSFITVAEDFADV